MGIHGPGLTHDAAFVWPIIYGVCLGCKPFAPPRYPKSSLIPTPAKVATWHTKIRHLAYWLLPSSVLQSDQSSSRALPEPSPFPGGPAFLLPVLALVRARPHHFRLLISRFESLAAHVLEIVQHEEQTFLAQVVPQRLTRGPALDLPQAQGPQDHRSHQEGITHESQADERDPVCEDLYLLHYVPGGLFELILPTWLIVKGLDSSTIAFKPSNTDDGGWTGVRRPLSQANKGLGMAFVDSEGCSSRVWHRVLWVPLITVSAT